MKCVIAIAVLLLVCTSGEGGGPRSSQAAEARGRPVVPSTCFKLAVEREMFSNIVDVPRASCISFMQEFDA